MYDFEGFLKENVSKYGGVASKVVEFFKDRQIECLLTDDIYECFGTQKTISKSAFYRLREALIDFVEFTDCPIKDRVVDRVKCLSQKDVAKRIDESAALYKNLDEIIGILNDIMDENGFHQSDALPLQSIAVLVWYDYTNEQIANMKISDIKDTNIPSQYKQILTDYSNIKYYRTLPSGKIQNLQTKEMLFRTANNDHLTAMDIQKIISKINTIVNKHNKMFARSIINKSRVFLLISQKYDAKSISSDVIHQYFGESMGVSEVEKTIVEFINWSKA